MRTARFRCPAIVFAIVSAGWTSLLAQAPQDHHEVHRLHGDPEAYIAALEDAARDDYQKPHEVLQALERFSKSSSTR